MLLKLVAVKKEQLFFHRTNGFYPDAHINLFIINMFRKLILTLPIALMLTLAVTAQTSSKSKSKDRFREKDDGRHPIKVTNAVELNKAGTDNAPSYFEGGILFCSSRGKHSVRDEATGEPFQEHFFSPFDPNGDPAPPTTFEFDASKKSSLHEGPVAFSRDFKTAYVTRTNNKDGVRKAGKDGVSRFKIYKTQAGRPDWTPAVELPFNSDDYSCMYPSLSPDGNKLFFCSDMPGGLGGFDLYVSEKGPDGWRTPRNLGPNINTEKQEVFPYMSLSGSLFFSSNGRTVSKGGLDIYFVNNPLTSPDEVINLDEPFNSPKNDYSLIIDDESKTGFFTSDREKGYGKDDIYRFIAERGLDGISKPEINPTSITVLDHKTGKPIQGASIRILQPSDDGFIGGSSKDFYTFDLTAVQDQPNALSLQLVRKGEDDMGAPDHLSNAEGKAQHDFIRYKSYLILVSTPGYQTSERLISVDTEENLKLDFKMREAPPCLRTGGMVATQEFGTRIFNATIKLVHKISGHIEKVHTNRNGEFDICLPLEGDYVGYVEREGFLNDNFEVKITKGVAPFPYSEVRLRAAEGVSAEETMPLASGIKEGSIIIMDKIFFEYEKATLNQSATRHIDALYDLLKRYPEMELELISHTETRGDAGMNMTLTETRSKNAKAYLAFRGIDANRIQASGRGEEEPRNQCKDGVECTDEQHQENNRLEIRIKKMGKMLKP